MNAECVRHCNKEKRENFSKDAVTQISNCNWKLLVTQPLVERIFVYNPTTNPDKKMLHKQNAPSIHIRLQSRKNNHRIKTIDAPPLSAFLSYIISSTDTNPCKVHSVSSCTVLSIKKFTHSHHVSDLKMTFMRADVLYWCWQEVPKCYDEWKSIVIVWCCHINGLIEVPYVTNPFMFE